MKTSITAVV